MYVRSQNLHWQADNILQICISTQITDKVHGWRVYSGTPDEQPPSLKTAPLLRPCFQKQGVVHLYQNEPLMRDHPSFKTTLE